MNEIRSFSRAATHHAVSRPRHSLAGRLAIVFLSAVTATAAAAEDWVTVASDSFTTLAVDRDSITATEARLYTVGAWFRYRFATSVKCEPPRGCYAASQRNYYYANCYTRTLALVQRRFMDLNDNVLAEADFIPSDYVPPAESLERKGLTSLCGYYRSAFPSWPPIAPYPP